MRCIRLFLKMKLLSITTSVAVSIIVYFNHCVHGLKFQVGPENFELLQERIIQQAQGLYGLSEWSITTSMIFSQEKSITRQQNYTGAVPEGEATEPANWDVAAYAWTFVSGKKTIACFQPKKRQDLASGLWEAPNAISIFSGGNLADIEEDGGGDYATTSILADPRPMPWLNSVQNIGTCFRSPVWDDDFTYPLRDLAGDAAVEAAKAKVKEFFGSGPEGDFPFDEYCGEGKTDEDCYKGYHKYLTTRTEYSYTNAGYNDYANADHPNTPECQKIGQGCSAAFAHTYKMFGGDLRFPDRSDNQLNKQQCTRFANKAIRAFAHDFFMGNAITGKLLDELNVPMNDGLCEFGRYVKDLSSATGCDSGSIIQNAAYLAFLKCGFNLNRESLIKGGLLFWNKKKPEGCFEMPDFKNLSSTDGLGQFALRYFGDETLGDGDRQFTEPITSMMRVFHQQGQVKCPPPGHRAGPFYPKEDQQMPASHFQMAAGNKEVFGAQCRFANAATEEITDARPERSFCAENYLSESPDALTKTRGEITVDHALNDVEGAFWWIHIMSRKDNSNQFGEACPFPLVSTLHKEIYLARTAKPSVDLSALEHYYAVSDDEDYWDSCGVCDVGPKDNICLNNQMSYDPAIDAGRDLIQTPANHTNVSYVPLTPDPTESSYFNGPSSPYESSINGPGSDDAYPIDVDPESAGTQEPGYEEGDNGEESHQGPGDVSGGDGTGQENAGAEHAGEGSDVTHADHQIDASEGESGTDDSSQNQETEETGHQSGVLTNTGTRDSHHPGYKRCIRT